MDRFDRELLDFVRSWAPYGGPPADDSWTEFGMSRDQLLNRARQLLAEESARREYVLRRPWLRLREEAGAAAPADGGDQSNPSHQIKALAKRAV
jgi:hypothetical protein